MYLVTQNCFFFLMYVCLGVTSPPFINAKRRKYKLCELFSAKTKMTICQSRQLKCTFTFGLVCYVCTTCANIHLSYKQLAESHS